MTDKPSENKRDGLIATACDWFRPMTTPIGALYASLVGIGSMVIIFAPEIMQIFTITLIIAGTGGYVREYRKMKMEKLMLDVIARMDARDEVAIKRDEVAIKRDEAAIKRDEVAIKRDEAVAKRDESMVMLTSVLGNMTGVLKDIASMLHTIDSKIDKR